MLTLNRIWLMLISLCTFVAVGCSNKSETPNTPAGPAKFTLETTVVEVSAEGGEYSVNYTIENPVENGVVTAVPKNSWIKLDKDYSNGVIRFTITENQSLTARETSIDVVYSGVEGKQSISVKQAGLEGEPFTLSNITKTDTSITVDVTPLDNTSSYICRILSKELIEAYELEEDFPLFNADISLLRDEATANNQSIKHYVTSLAHTGETGTYTFTNLTPNNTYVVFCYYIDIDAMGLIGEIHRQEVTTESPEMFDITFDMNLSVDGSNIKQTITPSDNSIYYFHDYMVLSEFYTWYGADATFEKAFEKRWNNLVLVQESWNIPIDQIIKNNCYQGKYEYTHELSDNTEYVFFVVAINHKTGFIASTPLAQTVKTNTANQSNLTINIAVSDIGANNATLTFTPSNNSDSYGCHFVKKSEWDSFGETDQQRIYSISQRYSLIERTETFQYTASKLDAATEYVAFAYGLVNENPTTGIFTAEFKTL